MKSHFHFSIRFARTIAAMALLTAISLPTFAAGKGKPLKVLLITGGCCHDYAAQKDILKKGLEARANVTIDQVHTDDKSTSPPLAIFGNPDYAKGYDVIIHDECAASIKDPKVVEGVLAPHRKGIPGVNLHCAMHSYRVGEFRQPVKPGSGDSLWFDYLGLQSSGHGPKEPIAIKFTGKHPVTNGLKDWKTGPEELYNNVQVFKGTKALASGLQTVKPRKGKGEPRDEKAVVVWANEYHGTRVFSTTIGHFNETVEDARYLDLVARGLLWSCDKLNKDYLK